MSPPNTPDRFWSLTERVGACLVWRSTLDRNGYGKLRFDGRQWAAHRLSWALTNGSIPAGIAVLHRCDNPPCVESTHLFLGTQSDNMRDMTAKGRNHRPGGEANARAHLTADQVAAIRELATTSATRRELAVQFGVSEPHISNIINRVRWA